MTTLGNDINDGGASTVRQNTIMLNVQPHHETVSRPGSTMMMASQQA